MRPYKFADRYNSLFENDNNVWIGWYPTPDAVKDLTNLGITLYINLVTVNEIQRMGSYAHLVRGDIIHFPITDQTIPPNDAAFKNLVNFVVNQVKAKRKILIHCMGGHGRSGTLAACMLKSMGYSTDNALAQVRKMHLKRSFLATFPTPSTDQQVEYVKRFE